MPVTVIDSQLFADQFSTAEMRAVFEDRATLQAWLDVEVALAKVEAELGIIPDEAARAIAAVGDAARYDLGALKREMDRTAHPIVPLVRAMDAEITGGLGEYVHWGATTQDILDTGTVLQVRRALELTEAGLERLLESLTDLARDHRDTPLAGRTHGQQALPVTLGYKAAVWVAEVRRHRARLAELRPRVLVAQFSGAVGTLASLGPRGLEVQAGIARELDLAPPEITWHTAKDGLVEVVCWLGLVAATCGKIAHEMYTLGRTELAEVEEPYPAGKIGSSTMPQKRNPAICESVVSLARIVRGLVPAAMEDIMAEHERDKIANNVEKATLAPAFCHTEAALGKTAALISGLTVKPDNMRRNMAISKGLLLSEAVMMRLAEAVGRQTAHDVVHAAAMAAFEQDRPLKELLMAEPAVTDVLSEADIDGLLDPATYTGLAAEMVDRVLSATGRP